MPLLNRQYDTIMRRYDEIRETNRHINEDHLEEVRRAIPDFEALESTITHLYAELGRCRIRRQAVPETLNRELTACRQKKSALLIEHGYPTDYLDMPYDCPICHDTGYVDGQKCRCFKKLAVSLLYHQYALEEILKEDTFAHFKIDCYSDTIKQEQDGRSARQIAQEACRAALKCAANIGEKNNDLLIYGSTGLGKTFLTHCIINYARSNDHSALYFSSADFFDLLADAAFNRFPESAAYADLIRTSDLLVIDDLGTERRNNLVESELFRVINERQTAGKTTVISTNLGPADIAAAYSERIFSRIISNYRIIKLIGEDIRLKNKLSGGNS